MPFYVPKTYANDLFSVGPQYIIEGGCFKLQQPRSNALRARDLNFFIKFRGVPNHIRALMCLFLLSSLLYSEFHRSSVAWMLLTLISKFLPGRRA